MLKISSTVGMVLGPQHVTTNAISTWIVGVVWSDITPMGRPEHRNAGRWPDTTGVCQHHSLDYRLGGSG